MKRIFISCMFVLLAAGAVSAQNDGGSRWSISPKTGMTVATHVGDDATNNSSSLAWAAGTEASFQPRRLLSCDFGLYYTRERVKESGSAQLVSSLYNLTLSHSRLVTERLDLPLMVGLHVLPGLTLKAGVQPSLLLSATTKYHIQGYTIDMESIQDRIYSDEDLAKLPKVPYNDEGSSGIKGEMSNIDVSIPVGASYEWRNIVVDARYHFGLMHAIKNQDVRRRYLLLTVGYRFGL